jgi:hypothetical protein
MVDQGIFGREALCGDKLLCIQVSVGFAELGMAFRGNLPQFMIMCHKSLFERFYSIPEKCFMN